MTRFVPCPKCRVGELYEDHMYDSCDICNDERTIDSQLASFYLPGGRHPKIRKWFSDQQKKHIDLVENYEINKEIDKRLFESEQFRVRLSETGNGLEKRIHDYSELDKIEEAIRLHGIDAVTVVDEIDAPEPGKQIPVWKQAIKWIFNIA